MSKSETSPNKKNSTSAREKWRSALQQILDEPEFKKNIEQKGYHDISDWSEFRSKYKLDKDGKFEKPQQWISLDFWSKPSSGSAQESILTEKGYYILRTGNGGFRIFDERFFPRPYLDLNRENAEKLDYVKEDDWKTLLNAYTIRHNQENPGLEFLNAFGIYDLIIEKLFGKQEWRVGPRGNTVSKFKVYAKNNQDVVQPLYEFEGQEELDYTIWTKDQILLIEAKKAQKKDEGLNLGWHKIAYPANRFMEFKKYKITPVYILRFDKIYHIFIFPVLEFHNNDGIIINDAEQLKPKHVFSVSTETSLDDF